MHNLKETASSSLSLPPNSYIYSIIPISSGSFAAISSDDSLRIFDALDGNLSPASIFANNTHQDGVTCLKSYSSSSQQLRLLVTAGYDGRVKLWDIRSRSPLLELSTNDTGMFLFLILFLFLCLIPSFTLQLQKMHLFHLSLVIPILTVSLLALSLCRIRQLLRFGKASIHLQSICCTPSRFRSRPKSAYSHQ